LIIDQSKHKTKFQVLIGLVNKPHKRRKPADTIPSIWSIQWEGTLLSIGLLTSIFMVVSRWAQTSSYFFIKRQTPNQEEAAP